MNSPTSTSADLSNTKSRIVHFLLIAITWVILLHSMPTSDPDFGWHYRSGERIWQTKEVPAHDWFTFTAPDFPWVDHEWLQDVIIYKLYQTTGLWGLKIWYASLAGLLLFSILGRFYPKDLSKELRAGITIVLACVLYGAALARPQIVTVLGFSTCLLIYLRIQQTKNHRYAFFLPLIFFLWANLHAGFIIGFSLLALVITTEFLKIKLMQRGDVAPFISPVISEEHTLTPKCLKNLFWCAILSAPLTLINPYGIRLYEEAYRTIVDEKKVMIAEWQLTNIEPTVGQAFYLMIILVVATFALRKRRPDLTNLVLILLFFIVGLSSIRNAIFFIIVSFLELIQTLDVPRNARLQNGIRAFLMFEMIITALGITFIHMRPPNETIEEQSMHSCPEAALSFIGKRGKQLRIFNFYSWGGCMIFRNPKLKIFIDGRMALWKQDGTHLIDEHLNVLQLGKGWETVLEKRKIDAVFIPKNSPLAEALKLMPSTWTETYTDTKAVIFERN